MKKMEWEKRGGGESGKGTKTQLPYPNWLRLSHIDLLIVGLQNT
jgi:hypothetical protein